MSTDRYSRQSFLGADSDEQIANCIIGTVGLGGGGSHAVQQQAHIGFKNYVLYDNDIVEESNLNRLIGAQFSDSLAETPKLHLAKKMIYGLQPHASVTGLSCKWQDNPEPLRRCHIVIGCVDSYKGRHELEIACRRYLIHYIDIGMDVHGTDSHVIGGQVILSSPGGPCLRCMGFLNDNKLGEEARHYGQAGPRPQVVWPNGVLASTAVGIAVDLVTNWTRRSLPYEYLSYNGNDATMVKSKTIKNLPSTPCLHFPNSDIGDPVLIAL